MNLVTKKILKGNTREDLLMMIKENVDRWDLASDIKFFPYERTPYQVLLKFKTIN